jgi:hypothetical protein
MSFQVTYQATQHVLFAGYVFMTCILWYCTLISCSIDYLDMFGASKTANIVIADITTPLVSAAYFMLSC